MQFSSFKLERPAVSSTLSGLVRPVLLGTDLSPSALSASVPGAHPTKAGVVCVHSTLPESLRFRSLSCSCVLGPCAGGESALLDLITRVSDRSVHVTCGAILSFSMPVLSRRWHTGVVVSPILFLLCLETKATWLRVDSGTSPVLERLWLEKKPTRTAEEEGKPLLPATANFERPSSLSTF